MFFFSSSLVGKQFKGLCPNDSTEKHLISFLLDKWFQALTTCMNCVWEKRALPNLCYIQTLKTLPKNVPLSKISKRALEKSVEKKVWGEKGHRRLIVTPTSASSIHIYNHCGSRAILGLHVNGLKKLFFVCCLSLLMKNVIFLWDLRFGHFISDIIYKIYFWKIRAAPVVLLVCHHWQHWGNLLLPREVLTSVTRILDLINTIIGVWSRSSWWCFLITQLKWLLRVCDSANQSKIISSIGFRVSAEQTVKSCSFLSWKISWPPRDGKKEHHERHKVSDDFSLSSKSNYKTQCHKCAGCIWAKAKQSLSAVVKHLV